ncbi:MAG: MFS transporter [SAR202 cluster bacterium]|nr:MFS transporter [SAR202 cluster bacterium]
MSKPNLRSSGRLFYGWIILFISIIILFFSMGMRNSVSVFFIPMVDEFDWNRATISIVFAAGWLINGLTQPVIGGVYDKFGGRYVISFGLLIMGLSTALISITNNFWYFLLMYGLIMCTSAGASSVVTVQPLLARWWYKRRGAILSISSLGISLGSMFLTPFSTYIIYISNWRLTWVVLGGCLLLVSFISVLFIRNNPSDIGILPYGMEDISNDKNEDLNINKGPLEVSSWKDAFKHLPAWQLMLSYMVCGLTTSFMSVHFIPLANDRGFTANEASIAFSMLYGFTILGVVISSLVVDKFGQKNFLTFVYIIRAFAYLILLFGHAYLGLWTFVILAGLSWVVTAPLTITLLADIYGLKTAGTLAGLATLAHQIGGSLNIILAGFLFDRYQSYSLIFIVSIVLLLIAAVATIKIQENKLSIRRIMNLRENVEGFKKIHSKMSM